jgi:hypothetical protein
MKVIIQLFNINEKNIKILNFPKYYNKERILIRSKNVCENYVR